MDMTNCQYDKGLRPLQEAEEEVLRGLRALGLPTKCRRGQSPNMMQ